MSGWIDQLSRGQVTSVKVVLTTVLVVLAVCRLCMAAVFHGKVRVPVLAGRIAALTHRSSGDAICVVVVLIASYRQASRRFNAGGSFLLNLPAPPRPLDIDPF